MSTKIKSLLKNYGEKSMLEEIGRNVIADRIKKTINSKRGIKPENVAVSLVFKKGDIIPSGFRGLPNINIDRNGVLQEDWTDSWCQGGWNDSGGWGDTWGECWDNSEDTAMSGGMHYINPVEWVAKPFTMENFSIEEQEILKSIGIR